MLNDVKPETKKTLGDIVKEERLSKHLGLREAANSMELTATGLTKIEQGETAEPTVNALISISNYLGIDMVKMLDALDKKPNSLDINVILNSNITVKYKEQTINGSEIRSLLDSLTSQQLA